jgi:glycosyltransferase involved in cell wall biosynthesis
MQNGSAPAATPAAILSDAGYQTYLGSYSALDRYFRTGQFASEIILTRGDLIALARLFDELTFPGFPLEHAATRVGDRSVFFRCADETEPWHRNPFTVLDLRYDPQTGVFLDPHDVYRDLRRAELVPVPGVHPEWVRLTEAARLVSRYHYAADSADLALSRDPPPVPPEYQRQILCHILTSPHPEKGLDLLLQACAGLEGDWRLTLVGSGEELEALRKLASEGGIADRVSLGVRLPSAEMPDFYRSLDLLVLPSRTRPNWKEQFGRVLIEAMACGVPVLGSDSGEIPHVIGSAGVVFPEGDVGALRSQLQRLMQDRAARERLAAAGRERVLAQYTMAEIARQTVAAYTAAADGR